MGWLFDNVLANMPGPNFLMFYPICAVVVLTAAYLFIAGLDATGGRPPPATPSVVDPYELSYLRGGVNEIIRAALYSLWRNRIVETADNERVRATGTDAEALNPIERAVLGAVSTAPKIPALFSNKSLRATLERLCDGYERRLNAQELLTPPAVRGMARLTLIVAGALLIALAGYKLAAAAAHGRSNIGFLVMEAVVVCFVLLLSFRRVSALQASRRGKAYLAQIQLAYSGHLGAIQSATTQSAPASAALGGSALLMVGLFGFAALKDTPDAAFAKAFAQSSGSDGGGGSCGGGDGGGGGCGGCGGGGGD